MASSKKVRGLLIEIGGDTTKLQTALKNVDKSTNALSKELRGINTLLKFDPSNTTLLSQKTKVLSESVEETKNRLETLKKAQEQLDSSAIDKNSSDYRDLQREIINTTNKLSDLKNATSSFNKVGNSLEKFGNNISDVGKNIDKIGNKLTTGLTLPIVALGTYATKSAMDFESAFAGVKKTVDATEEEYSKFSEEIIEMSKKLPATATEISAVAEAAGQLGIHNDSLLEFTKTMIDLGESTNLSANEAATQLARFANITSMSQRDFDKLGSVIVDLGNNFATTESEIVSMGLRLAGAGKQVGMSEAQIMSFATALSSVGIEAEAGGSAFSKVMLKIESDVATNANRLSKWAEVAGLSVAEFKELWEKDAAGALSKFIEGLGGLDAKGGNAVLTLEDMGLTEVRLRDSLLRASNASGVFTSALETGNKAWKENTALVTEAEKRYETTESQMNIAKNQLNAIAISLGKELLPYVNNALKYIGKLADKFADMTDEEQKTLLKTLAFAAAIGPVSKGVSKLTSVVGTTTRGIGKFTKAIGLAKNGIGTATGSTAKLAREISALTSPVGLTVTSIGLLTAGLMALSKHETEEQKNIRSINESINSQIKTRKDLMATQFSETEAKLREVDSTQLLYNELRTLVDENGKVKEGYEDRVNFILGELNNALDTEYSSVDGIVQKYNELVKNIDMLIAKKRTEIILEKQKAAYDKAIEQEAAAIETVIKAKEEQKKAQDELNAAQEKYNEARKKYNSDSEFKLSAEFRTLTGEVGDATNSVNKANEALKNAKKNYDQIKDAIDTYDINSIKAQSGSLKELNSIILENSRVELENSDIKGNITEREIKSYEARLEAAKKKYKEEYEAADKTTKQILENQVITNQQMLNDTIESLVSQTSAVEENSPEVIAAWKTLADTSKNDYQMALATMPTETRQAIEKITGVTYDSTTGAAMAWANMALTNKEEFSKNLQGLPEDMQQNIIKIADSVNKNGGKVTKETKKLTKSVIKDLKNEELDNGYYQAGVNVLTGLSKGMKDKKTRAQLSKDAYDVGQFTLGSLKKGLNEHSPSATSEKYGKWIDDGLAIGVKKNTDVAVKAAKDMSSKVLEAAEVSSRMNDLGFDSKINSKIMDATRTVFTTPNIQFNVQKMDQQNLDMAFNYINKKFGSQY